MTDATGYDFEHQGWEDDADYLVVRVVAEGEEIPAGEQPIIVSKMTGEVRDLMMVENLERVRQMAPVGHRARSAYGRQ